MTAPDGWKILTEMSCRSFIYSSGIHYIHLFKDQTRLHVLDVLVIYLWVFFNMGVTSYVCVIIHIFAHSCICRFRIENSLRPSSQSTVPVKNTLKCDPKLHISLAMWPVESSVHCDRRLLIIMFIHNKRVCTLLILFDNIHNIYWY